MSGDPGDSQTLPVIEPPRGFWARTTAFFRQRIIAGLVFLIPFVLTVWLVVTLFQFADGILGRYVNNLLRQYGVIERAIPTLGILLLGFVLLFVGFFATSRFGQKLTTPIERALLSIPIVKSIYSSTKQILHSLVLTGKGGAFQKVALVEYPRKGLFAIGFVTGEISRSITTRDRHYERLYTVFVPTTPNPTSGFLALSPVEDTILLDMSVEDGIKIILSGGFVQADLEMISTSELTTRPLPGDSSPKA